MTKVISFCIVRPPGHHAGPSTEFKHSISNKYPTLKELQENKGMEKTEKVSNLFEILEYIPLYDYTMPGDDSKYPIGDHVKKVYYMTKNIKDIYTEEDGRLCQFEFPEGVYNGVTVDRDTVFLQKIGYYPKVQLPKSNLEKTVYYVLTDDRRPDEKPKCSIQ